MLIYVKKAHLYGELEDHESAFVLPLDGECEQRKLLEAPTLVLWHAASCERLGETLLEDPLGHGLREGGDSRDRILRQGSRRSVRGARRRLHFSRVGGRPSRREGWHEGEVRAQSPRGPWWSVGETSAR